MSGKRGGEALPSGSKKLCSFTASLRPTLKTDINKSNILDAWVKDEETLPLSEVQVTSVSKPFKCCQVKNFIEERRFVLALKEELEEIDFNEKNNDLYQFQQSVDLVNVKRAAINCFRNFMLDECKNWIQDVTGIDLCNKLSVTCSCYNDTDYLLCHDDKCDDRRIAFILYLNEEWKESDGGALQLFNTKDNQPDHVSYSILPEFNSMVFFEVTDKSFHHVAEVLTPSKSRLTLNGWFHSSVHAKRLKTQQAMPTLLLPNITYKSETLFQYLNPFYITAEHKEMSENFENDSELLLQEFLLPEFYNGVSESLRSDDIVWIKKGPVNRRNYYVPDEKTLPEIVKTFINIFSSSVMMSLLGKITSLDLDDTDPESDSKSCEEAGNSSTNNMCHSPGNSPKFYYEVQKWEKGCYTLINDDDSVFTVNGLDAIMFFNTEGIEENHGGFISYIARDDDEELLTILPEENALALAFRDQETLRFVKYINHYFTGTFYSIMFVYHERENDT